MRPNAKVLELRERALSAIRSVARIGPHFKPTALEIEADGTATIQAEVDNIAIKRLALERLAATKGITAIVDRLRVKPAQAMSDDGGRQGVIRTSTCSEAVAGPCGPAKSIVIVAVCGPCAGTGGR